MTLFTASNNQIGFFYDSGTYAVPTGAALQWIGQVNSHEINPNMNVFRRRYMGGGDRNVQQFVDGPKDFDGNLVYNPQNWKMLIFALGSNVDAGSPSPYSHTISEANGAGRYNAYTSGNLNPFLSFTVEEAQVYSAGSNVVRTASGCIIGDMAIRASQGGLVEVEINYVAQDVGFASGAATTITEDTSRPFRFDDCLVHLPSGTTIPTTTDYNWNVNNTLDRKHYINGSRVLIQPTPTERNYGFDVTLDANAINYKSFYDQYFIGGSTFNAALAIAAADAGAGSRDMYMAMSGCKMVDMPTPLGVEGLNSVTLNIEPATCSAVIADTIQFYNPW